MIINRENKNTSLIIIEGLPGSGKSTVARIVEELLAEQAIDTNLYLEGNLDHPADYDGVAYYTFEQFNQLLKEQPQYRQLLGSSSINIGSNYFVPYRKLQEELSLDFPDEFIQLVSQHDIYELPYDVHVKLITAKWHTFVADHVQGKSTYIFECCFIQNPLTIGLVKYNVLQTDIIDYVLKLENAVKVLNPLLIYVDQPDVEATFRKAVRERPREWSDGFIDYYTNQGYGASLHTSGVEGTVQVLQERKRIELDIYDRLNIHKVMLDNSQFDIGACTEKLRGVLKDIIG